MYVPTTVFTPLEYGACGLPEEDARNIYGSANIDVSAMSHIDSIAHPTSHLIRLCTVAGVVTVVSVRI